MTDFVSSNCIEYIVFNTYNVWNLISIPFALQDPIKQFMDIDVGLKMNSYTVNNLEPGVEYLFELCLRKESYIIPISSTLLTTRNSGYEVALGIETDYVTLGAVTVILTTLVISCFAISFLRWYVHLFWNIQVFGDFSYIQSPTHLYTFQVHLSPSLDAHEVQIWRQFISKRNYHVTFRTLKCYLSQLSFK